MKEKQIREYFQALIDEKTSPLCEKGEGVSQRESLILWKQDGISYQVIITQDGTLLFVRNGKVVLTCPCESVTTISCLPSGTLIVRIGKDIKLVHGTLS